jgi:hypothetical protein
MEGRTVLTFEVSANYWVIALALALISAFLAAWLPKTGRWRYVHWAIIVFWILGPPAITLHDMSAVAGEKLAIPATQPLYLNAIDKFWGAVLALLAAIYTKDSWLK